MNSSNQSKRSEDMEVTEYANLALAELHQAVFVCRQIANDIKYDESLLQNRKNKRPDLLSVTNEPFNNAASRFIGVSLLCVDIYNSYCRESLKLALSSNPKLVVDAIRKQTGTITETIVKADKKGKDAATEVIREFLSKRYRGDRGIRETIHRNLDVIQKM
jgi:hypothetical protein